MKKFRITKKIVEEIKHSIKKNKEQEVLFNIFISCRKRRAHSHKQLIKNTYPLHFYNGEKFKFLADTSCYPYKLELYKNWDNMFVPIKAWTLSKNEMFFLQLELPKIW